MTTLHLSLLFLLCVVVKLEARGPNKGSGNGEFDVLDPHSASLVAPRVIGKLNLGQPSEPYNTNNVPADIRANMPANAEGTFSGNNELFTMPSDPEHQPKRTNPNKWEDYYKEDNTPEPPPLPKGQENPFEVADPKINPPESKDMLPPQ